MLLTITNRSLPLGRLFTARGLAVLRTLLGACLLLASAAHAQFPYTPPPPPLSTAPCKPTKKDPCTQPAPAIKEKFPFPGEPDAGKGDPAAAMQPAKDSQLSGGQPAPPGAPASAAPRPQPFAFPGEPEDAPPAPATSSSHSSSSSSSSGDVPSPEPAPDATRPAFKDLGSSGSTRAQRRHLPKVEDLNHREEEDLQVSRYYISTGNFQAAYMRAQDAVKTIPTDPDAHFALAESARHVGKNDEATTEYTLYLKLDPEGDNAKAAQRALTAAAQK